MKTNYKPHLDKKMKLLLKLLSPKPSDKILVIGTGVYPKIEFFLYNNYNCKNITSGDIDAKNIKNAKAVLPKLNFIYLDAQKKFPFKANSFNKTIFTDVLEHLPNEILPLREINRTLKRSGKLLITLPKKRWFNIFSPITHIQHIREYDERKITKLLNSAGFKIDRLIIGGSFLNLIGLWIHLLLKYGFNYLHPNLFFEKQVGKTYEKGFKGTGTDIIIKARSC